MFSVQWMKELEAGGRLSQAEAQSVMEELLAGEMDTPLILRLLVAYNQRLITVPELTGFARSMRAHAAKVFADHETRPAGMVDTCGTGGDNSGTFNISTASALTAAAAGVRIAKHGNRSASSRSGSADVLEALGVRIDVPMERAGQAIREIGIGFLFAQTAHTAARHAAAARKQFGRRSIFNLLGPLTNPAGAQFQVLGVFSPDVLELTAQTLLELGVERAFVMHGAGGLDEFSLAGETQVVEVQNQSLQRYSVTPEEFGISRAELRELQGGSAEENAKIIEKILHGESGPKTDIVIMNAAAAIGVTGAAANFREAAECARSALKNGLAEAKLAQLKHFLAH